MKDLQQLREKIRIDLDGEIVKQYAFMADLLRAIQIFEDAYQQATVKVQDDLRSIHPDDTMETLKLDKTTISLINNGLQIT